MTLRETILASQEELKFVKQDLGNLSQNTRSELDVLVTALVNVHESGQKALIQQKIHEVQSLHDRANEALELIEGI